MNINGLSFNALPPIDLPFRFFLTAPIFIILCAFLILFSGEALWLSRWQPSMLALTHGFTLGFLTMVMMGALLQLLPVIGGVGIVKPRLVVYFCHSTLVIGTLCLMANFIWPSTLLAISSLIFLVCSIGVYFFALAWVLVKKLSQGDSIIGFRLAMSALFIVLLLGAGLLSQSIGFISINGMGKMLTNNHALFGLAGWGSLLIISVSFQVIPMFHVAPSFPKLISRYLPSSLFILLIIAFFQPVFVVPIIVLIHGVFALSLLLVISKRKRKIPDSTIRFWQLAALTLIGLNIFYFTPNKYLSPLVSQQKTLLITAIYLYFYLIAVIQGMLLKILPFLSYTHLQQKCLINFSAMQVIPHMHNFLNKKHGQWLFYLHIMTGMVLFYTLVIPSAYWLLSLLLLIEFSWLLYLMIKAMRLYFLTLTKINSFVNE
ncbi:hypothetical protein [Candidatus Colwellia aromaticivorans]|uniref:hypothetical protein n=1 Tax=Candidatus Colwellia aromaticivorans TaxID=2267621 RepID=UPI000DF19535|nr:hypothetical protein [Candidatus Colwellia aromaticivorans]